MPNTLLYTSYMKRVVATRSHAEGLAVMLPCYWVYRHIGNCMLKLREDLGDRYERSRWELLAFCLPPMGGSQKLFATTILSSKCLSSTSIWWMDRHVCRGKFWSQCNKICCARGRGLPGCRWTNLWGHEAAFPNVVQARVHVLGSGTSPNSVAKDCIRSDVWNSDLC